MRVPEIGPALHTHKENRWFQAAGEQIPGPFRGPLSDRETIV